MHATSKQIAASLCILGLAGCSTPPTLTSLPNGPAQTATYIQGRPILTEVEPSSSAVVTLISPDADGRLAFWIGVTNRGKSPLNFGIENVSAESDGKPLRVFTYAELARHEKVKLGWGIAATILGGAAGVAAASQPTMVRTSGNTYVLNNRGGVAYGGYSGTATVYDPAQSAAAAAVISSEAGGQAAALKGNYRSNMAALQQILQLNTVLPNTTRGGIVLTDSGDLKAGVKVHVEFADVQRDFSFKEQ